MKNIDKLHRIKDFFNKVLKEVYNMPDKKLINHIIPINSAEHGLWTNKAWDIEMKGFESSILGKAILMDMYRGTPPQYAPNTDHIHKDSTAIIYDNREFYINSISKYDGSVSDILMRLFGTSLLKGIKSVLKITPTYNKIFPLLEYSGDELGLYLKMKS